MPVETVFFLHVLAAFALAASAVMFCAFAVGATPDGPAVPVASRLWDVGGLGTLVFGVWLALDEYEITDGWILASLGLWIVASAFGGAGRIENAAPGEQAARARETAVWNWLRAVAALAILVLMIWKPGA